MREGGAQGFTLLEVLIALAIIVVIVMVTVLSQGSSASSAARNKNVLIATNLARNKINELELRFEGISFDRLPLSKETQSFPEPDQDFKYTVEFSEVDFSPLTELINRQAAAAAEGGKKKEGDENLGAVMSIFKEYLKKSVRRMTVTIEWTESGAPASQSFTELLVNYDTDFNITI